MVGLRQRLCEQQLTARLFRSIRERDTKVANRPLGIAPAQRLLSARSKLLPQGYAPCRETSKEDRRNRVECHRRQNQHQERDTVPKNDLASRAECRACRRHAGGICLCVDDVLLELTESAEE